MTDIELEVAGGCCVLRFKPGCSTGGGGDLNPGIGFDQVSELAAHERQGKFYSGMGVIGRADAARLRDMLDAFLSQHPA